ncbi:cation:proton antiporter [Kitasatospora sp. RB6PN24]|uniref:cation:proton antiporter n=1 Tax=Kitasatospora humi TaxID=2893891 RepID=UPI001E5D20FC|nr:cation:proton antiporter [Kitasatospora humi]MCC9306001.1 cation:proton antiporter [Kitasatospora humi]
MTQQQILLGIGLTLVLAVGCQVLADRLRVPALVLLLPAGFTAGALTVVVNPVRLIGPAFTPLVSLAVAVILYDAGTGLDRRRLKGHTRRVVVRLIALGVPITWAGGLLFAELCFGLPYRAAVMLGAILVVSGPTVVGPLLAFVRPVERLQHILVWEGSLVDPVGGILGALVFHAVSASTRSHPAHKVVQFLESAGTGLAGGVVGVLALWLLLGRLRLPEILGTSAQLAVVVGVAAVCDALRDDSGLLAAVLIGVGVRNVRGLDLPARSPFFENLVQLILGVLFVSISATITPASLRHLFLPTLGFIALLVLVVRPVVAAVSTLRTDLPRGERSFIGWMDPRGIVAASTAATFSASLAAKGVAGAAKILPITFLVIVGTVVLYAFTASPVAGRLGVRRAARARPLLVGGDPWAVDLGRAFADAGIDVLMWAGAGEQRDRIRRAGLELAPGELLAAATGEGAELEGVTAVLLLTDEDDFNALAATVLRGGSQAGVYRTGPPAGSHGVIAPFTGGEILFGPALSRAELDRRHAAGAVIITRPSDGAVPEGTEVLFRIRADGSLAPVTRGRSPEAHPGDAEVLLGPPAALIRDRGAVGTPPRP